MIVIYKLNKEGNMPDKKFEQIRNMCIEWCNRHNSILIQIYTHSFAYMTYSGESYIMSFDEMKGGI